MALKSSFNPRLTRNEIREKVRENRLRRMLSRRGYMLKKSRRRDPGAIGYGGYMILDVQTNGIVAGTDGFDFSLNLDDVEKWMK